MTLKPFRTPLLAILLGPVTSLVYSSPGVQKTDPGGQQAEQQWIELERKSQMSDSTKEILLSALERAAAAHGKYETEVLGGVYDTEWPQWYAGHMARELAEQGYRVISDPILPTSHR